MHHLWIFSIDPALSIKERVASNIFCLIGALAEQATKAKYLKRILNSSMVLALGVDMLVSDLLLMNESNLSLIWSEPVKKIDFSNESSLSLIQYQRVRQLYKCTEYHHLLLFQNTLLKII